MMFTLVTVIFLPLSFMSSIFGMNNKEFGGDGNPWVLGDQIKFMCKSFHTPSDPPNMLKKT
jgi:Mg2+ and Co2+ transporter CorA